MSNERILYFCSRLPSNIQSGLDLRVSHQILELEKFCEVAVFGLVGSGKKISPRINIWKSSTDLTVAEPITLKNGGLKFLTGENPFASRFSLHVANELKELIRDFKPTKIIISRLALVSYLEVFEDADIGEIILDLDEVEKDAFSSILESMDNKVQIVIYRRFLQILTEYERNAIGRVSKIWLSSKLEIDKLKKSYSDSPTPQGGIHVVPNVVDIGSYDLPSISRGRQSILYPASFGFEPAISSANFLVEELMPKLPEFQLRLVGSDMPPWMFELESKNILVVNNVLNIKEYFCSSSLIAIPLRAGGGTRLKVIEALASHLPIVSTTFGTEGLDLIPGEHFLPAETSEEFAAACLRLENDLELRKSLVAEGFRFVSANYSIKNLGDSLKKGIL
jgi:glycosyltransferase involved in cell wall biosynthesis